MALNVLKRVKLFVKDECGAAMVEYGVALLVVTAIGVTMMNTLGEEVEANISEACTSIAGGTAPAGCQDDPT